MSKPIDNSPICTESEEFEILGGNGCIYTCKLRGMEFYGDQPCTEVDAYNCPYYRRFYER